MEKHDADDYAAASEGAYIGTKQAATAKKQISGAEQAAREKFSRDVHHFIRGIQEARDAGITDDVLVDGFMRVADTVPGSQPFVATLQQSAATRDLS